MRGSVVASYSSTFYYNANVMQNSAVIILHHFINYDIKNVIVMPQLVPAKNRWPKAHVKTCGQGNYRTINL